MKAVVTHKNATHKGKKLAVGDIIDLKEFDNKIPSFLVNKARMVDAEPVAAEPDAVKTDDVKNDATKATK